MRTDISKIHDNSKWTELTPGNHVYGGGTSKAFNTGEWRTSTPVLDEMRTLSSVRTCLSGFMHSGRIRQASRI